jgi:hypothetical protein
MNPDGPLWLAVLVVFSQPSQGMAPRHPVFSRHRKDRAGDWE